MTILQLIFVWSGYLTMNQFMLLRLWTRSLNRCFSLSVYRLIIEKEGPRALFKGLGPNIVGVAPSRAIYFCSYSQSKKTFNQIFPADSPIVHICSAATAGKEWSWIRTMTNTNRLWTFSQPLTPTQMHFCRIKILNSSRLFSYLLLRNRDKTTSDVFWLSHWRKQENWRMASVLSFPS